MRSRDGKKLSRNREKRWEYLSCGRKRKFKSAEASKWADRFGQRKYECPVCGGWHLTKQRGE